jgi:hypothetical protein
MESMKNVFYLFIIFLLFSCKKSRDMPFPSDSYLTLLVDGKTYEYYGKELGGTYDQGWGTSSAHTMLYTTGIALTKPAFYISADAPGLTKEGKFWVTDCTYGIDPLVGPYFQVITSTDPEKRKLIITRLNNNQLQWEGQFYVELTDSTNNTRVTTGSFAISIK